MSGYSGYRFVWLIVMFDLPVLTKPQRRGATRFRNDLLDLGFQMSQYSIYMRFFANREAAQAQIRKIKAAVPGEGAVSILTITDKQYENMVIFHGAAQEPRSARKRRQLLLF